MTLKHLKIFAAVYEQSSITLAAQRLKITQPAASLAIKELENYYQTKLFERKGRSIYPNSAGSRLYSTASHLLSLYAQMEQDMKNWSQSSQLRIGSSISIGSHILPDYLEQFIKKFPQSDYSVCIDCCEQLEQKLLNHQLDVALIDGNISSEKLQTTIFLQDEMLPICGNNHPFAGAADVSLSEFTQENFLMRNQPSGIRQFVDSFFASRHIAITSTWESASNTALIHAASKNLGISILPKQILEKPLRSHQIATFSLESLLPPYPCYLVYAKKKENSPTLQSFFDLVLPPKPHLPKTLTPEIH